MDAIASLTANVGPDPLAELGRPPGGVSMVELRADLLPGLDPALAVAACPLPVLVTLRSTAEGGRGPDDPAVRATLLERARDAGAALIDLELERDLPLLRQLGLDPERVVLSWHDTAGTPADLDAVVERLLATPARWLKAVPTARSLSDLFAVIALQRRFGQGSPAARRLIAFAMGPIGQPSRFLAPLLGPPLAYVAWTGAAAAAPGQVTMHRLDAVVGHLTAAPQRLYGVAGADVTASLSPELHGAAYRELDLPYALLPFSVPDAAEARALLDPRCVRPEHGTSLEFSGWAVTAPYKDLAFELATIPAPRARTARAANTLVPRHDQLLADTTDADGVVGSLLAAGLSPAGLTALVAGSGGAARGAVVGLDLAGAHVVMRGRDAGRSAGIARTLGVESAGPGATVPADVLVNATPLGKNADDRSPFADDEVAAARVVLDMVYGDEPNRLRRQAEMSDTVYIDGRSMLLHQGIPQFAAMTGRVPPKATMSAAISTDR